MEITTYFQSIFDFHGWFEQKFLSLAFLDHEERIYVYNIRIYARDILFRHVRLVARSSALEPFTSICVLPWQMKYLAFQQLISRREYRSHIEIFGFHDQITCLLCICTKSFPLFRNYSLSAF